MFQVWGRRSSSNVQKVLWALQEAGVEYERETVGGSFGGTDTKEYRKLNPNGLVPVIKDADEKNFLGMARSKDNFLSGLFLQSRGYGQVLQE